ncbi:peroxiredoxin, subfamily protein [Kurthia sp. 11kri321]|uniref:OsmC family protein n=1 Tax=Kurthia sp. 11kri321 TaxID=1750719 RepID=UPI000745EE23|nr:OsmC family protein [Kurthia sp. 11kri321]AMA64221.1 peroxiredoxin, subfamily protein [Kurthia sp. 11kri321]
MTAHRFILEAQWPGGRNEVGTISSGQLQTKISIPKEMDGPGVGTNPDEMLLGAAATCYLISYAAMLERAKIIPVDLTLSSAGIVDVTNGVFTYEKITHHPTILLEKNTDERTQRMVQRLAEKAEKTCMISKAIRGNVELALNVTIQFANE